MAVLAMWVFALAPASEALALEWLNLSVSGGPAMAGVMVDSYGTADGHETSAEPSYGFQAELSAEFLGFLMLASRFAALDLAPSQNSSLVAVPSLLAGLKSPALGFLPELYARVGLTKASGRVGGPDDYHYQFDVFWMVNLGVRYMFPEFVPLVGGFGIYLDGTLYANPITTIPTISLGAVWQFL